MLGHLFGAARLRQVAFDALVRHVAEASVEAVAELAAPHVVNMGPCEARGYIRARAGLELRRQARHAIAQHGDVAASWEQDVAVGAAERIAQLVMRRLASQGTVGASLRRAA